jgi:hypothetical protein
VEGLPSWLVNAQTVVIAGAGEPDGGREVAVAEKVQRGEQEQEQEEQQEGSSVGE